MTDEVQKKRTYYEANKEARNAYAKAYYQANKEARKQKMKDSSKAYYQANKESLKAYAKEYREYNRESIKEYWNTYYEANKEVIKEVRKAYCEANKSAKTAYNKAYYEANKESIIRSQGTRSAKRRAKLKVELTPDEAKRVREIYKHRDFVSNAIGTDYHVDHALPISKGGPHHPDNLMILRADYNQRKSAMVSEDWVKICEWVNKRD